jgi:NAD(P)-dependent dehydrogenase (short-subunit alcohol dehydrogenase family)
MSGWTDAQIPDQTGRTAVVTGSNSGIGFQAARRLASTGLASSSRCAIPTAARPRPSGS